ncbi:MAG: hypothetical protein Q9204_004383 [Flavoplaca sp. TL-2023a]
MKPVVSALNAWSCVVVSVFAIVILSIIGGLFKSNHHSMVGTTKDPDNGPAVAGSVFAAVIVYVVRLLLPYTRQTSSYLSIRRGNVQLKKLTWARGYRSFSPSAAFRHSYIIGKVRGGRYR